MRKRDSARDNSLRCSFCHKAETAVGKLISTPSDYPRAYICDECVAVCQSILEDDTAEAEQTQESPEVSLDHPLLSHPLASSLMAAIEDWIRDEAAGADAASAFGDVRRIAMQMLRK